MVLKSLRKKYPEFVYEKYSYKLTKKNLEIFFDFKIEPKIKFNPKIIIESINEKDISRVGENILNNFIFHLGLIEIPSYWKVACSPEIIIRAGYLNKEQIKWWKRLLIRGMGQFFYENKIDFRKPNFLKIENFPRSDLGKVAGGQPSLKFKNRVLVPIGGGKDSIVTLEKLKEKREEIGCFLVNPTEAMREIVKVAKIKNPVIVRRKIDPTLLELNKRGFLNGHTPITAVYSFLSILAAVLFNYKHIAFSNEKSADEGNLRYLGKIINHQWSKSSEFEKMFRNYCQKYLVKGINYFSYLRKYTELEIAKMFTKYPQYFSVFSSCNVVLAPYRVAKGDSGTGLARKLKKRPASAKSFGEARWCGNCPKCLFTYAILYPFLERDQLLKIFGSDIFENKKLLPVMKGLINPAVAKPFECVGTKKESQMAFYLSLKKANREEKIPFLLKYFQNKIMSSLPRRISSISERFLRG